MSIVRSSLLIEVSKFNIMKLTGKCKEDFEKWLYCGTPYSYFLELTPSMQYGVYVDFFDSVRISLMVYTYDDEKWYVNLLKNNRYLIIGKEMYKTRQEARTQAIKKANEIYNSKHI